MITLAIPSLRHRLPSFTATLIAVFLSTLVVGAFATMIETATGSVTDHDREMLIIMGAVIGSWGALIALFALVSTLAVGIRRRDVEIGLLRTLGATPRQARRLIRAETLVVALVAAGAGAVFAWPAGAWLLSAVQDAGMVSDAVGYGGGVASLSITVVAVLVISVASAGLASRRATRGAARMALAAEPVNTRLPRWRFVIGMLLIAYAIALGFVTVLVMADTGDPYNALQTSGSAALLAAMGLAAVGPTLLRASTRIARPLLRRTGPALYLATTNTALRAHLLGGVLGPIIMFVGAGAGMLMLTTVDTRTLVLPPEMTASDAEMVTTLNNVVTGMIALFAAILMVNAIAAIIGDRREEFARLRLVGATAQQIRAAVTTETALVASIGVALGLLAAVATVVPFALARDEGVVPNGGLWLPVAVGSTAIALSVGSARWALRNCQTGQR